MANYKNTIRYYLEDFHRTLFPLETNRILVEHGTSAIGRIVSEARATGSKCKQRFLPQVRVYAAKPQSHLRRTLKLDPIAEFFLYQLTYEYRQSFKDSVRSERKVFGYRFNGTRMMSPAISYRQFRSTVRTNLRKYKFCVKADVAQYFNSLSAESLIEWFSIRELKERDGEALARFFYDINSGRSVDCLPHGIYPAKILGSQFLGFFEETLLLTAAETCRFMDDLYMFDDDEHRLEADFHTLQRLLGSKGLSLNSSKTQFGRVEELNIQREVDNIKRRLLKRRGDIVLASAADEDYWDDDEEESTLSEEEVEYLLDLLSDEHIEEEDAELVLAVMRDHAEDVLEHVKPMLTRFPSLSKNIYHFCRFVDDRAALAQMIKEFVSTSPVVTEFQLFWLARVCEDVLWDLDGIGDLLIALYLHPNATVISRGKVLEIPERRFGLPDIREQEIKSGAMEWTAWCAAMGSRALPRRNRTELLRNFSSRGSLSAIVYDCVRALPEVTPSRKRRAKS